MAYKRKGNKIINKHGVKITTDEMKELRRLVNKSNRQRDKLQREINEQPRMIMGKATGETIGDFRSKAMGGNFKTSFEESFIQSKKSANLNQFKDQKALKIYLKNLKGLDDAEGVIQKAQSYKDNYIKSMKNGLNLHGNSKLIQMLKKIPTKEFIKLASTDERINIQYMYGPSQVDSKIKELSQIFNNFIGGLENGK